ncbi:MAG TPA: zinc ribbon domain-containing protein [Thermotogota bacterium]|nr:zinc ribbon domain-containing protein [Thermotogota bacterium]HRW34713.1 zinc ribbon domain-containing protein [Thermotogota bacterium]
MEQLVCQSCGMPLKEELFGTEKDGSLNQEYCVYCYKDGSFTSECTMEEMIETCVPFMEEQGMNKEEARALLEKELPKLRRWGQKGH